MRNSKKLLIGVLSVAALIGTGYAAWTIGGVFTDATEELNPIVEETIGTRDIALQVSKDPNDNIKFDSAEDLKVTYNVKAVKAETNLIEDFDPYDLSHYDKVAEDYQPDLTVSAKALDSTTGDPLDPSDEFFKIVNLPEEVTYEYNKWLAKDYKDNGFPVELVFTWGESTGGLNPQDYLDSKLASKTQKEQRDFLQDIIDNLQGVKFEFTFKVGGAVIDDPEPVEDTTGEVTAPSVADSTFLIDGEAISGSLTAGKHQITITTEDGKVVKDNKLIVVENGEDKEVTLTESLTRAAHTYTATYIFLKDATYSFKYNVVDEEVIEESVVYSYDPDLVNGELSGGNVYTINLSEGGRTTDDVLQAINNTSAPLSQNLITEVTSYENIFEPNSNTGKSGIRFSSGSKAGSFAFKTSSAVSKISVTYIAWKGDSASLRINDSINENESDPKYDDGKTKETHVFEITEPTAEFVFAAGKANKCRFAITEIEFWLA